MKQYLPGHVRAPVQIKLHRALRMVTAGEIAEGLQYARTTMTDLPHSHYVRPIIDGAYTVLASVPVEQHGRPAYADFADYLATSQSLRYGQA
ncbi:hypothetical protein [Dactylosporangium sp. CA-233914]|uniref:hypothetical protein n=1 Tax=Dactylosporangium sp. CA-233914 TaxID=3239934 RepID=UPI003D8E131F